MFWQPQHQYIADLLIATAAGATNIDTPYVSAARIAIICTCGIAIGTRLRHDNSCINR